MTTKLPVMPLWVDDYRNDTRGFTLEEHGAYLLLLMEMWHESGSIAYDDSEISRMLGVMPEALPRLMQRLMPRLSSYGPETGKRLTQKRLQKEWNYAVENSARQSAKGRLGASKRWEAKQLLDGRGIGPGNGRKHGRKHGRTIAPKKDNIIYSLQDAAREDSPHEGGPAREAGDQLTDKPAEDKSYLLQTDLIRRAARKDSGK